MDLRIRTYWFSLYLFVSSPFVALTQPTFTLNGSAAVVSDNCYRLTSPRVGNDVGAMWGDFTVDLRNSLEIRFAINLGCAKSVGEGMAFVMHTDKDGMSALGCAGASLGYGRSNGCTGISSSLAIEFDTRHTAGQRDMYRPHLAIVRDGDMARPLTEPVAMADKKDVLDCEYHDVRITWSPSKQELCVYFDGNLRLTHKGDLTNSVFGGSSNIYFGFTGSTSQQPTMQMLCVQSVVMEIDEVFERKLTFEQGVGIYSNPLRERLTINLAFEEDEYIQMQLYDSSGKLIYEIPTHLVRENEYFFNLPGLPSGVYYITVTNGTERVSKKIVHVATMRA